MDIFGLFMLLLIGIELLETAMKTYLTQGWLERNAKKSPLITLGPHLPSADQQGPPGEFGDAPRGDESSSSLTLKSNVRGLTGF